jgi:hypothetical protein
MIPNCLIIADRTSLITRAHHLTSYLLHRTFPFRRFDSCHSVALIGDPA